MKKINSAYIYTITHTGTSFLLNLIRSVYCNKEDTFTIRDKDYTELGKVFDFNSFSHYELTKYWQYYNKLKYIEDLNNHEFVIVHNHINVGNAPIVLNTLSVCKPEIPVITTMRDPLLSYNSRIWRWGKLNKMTNIERYKFIKWRTRLFIKILEIPEDNIFLFPIDHPEAGKMSFSFNLVSRLFKLLNIPFTDAAKNIAYYWKPVGLTTKDIQAFNQGTKHFKGEYTDTPRLIKDAILNKDKKTVLKYYDLEMEYLQTQNKLKKLMYNIGYRDLIWW